jgi:hypothetical protein
MASKGTPRQRRTAQDDPGSTAGTEGTVGSGNTDEAVVDDRLTVDSPANVWVKLTMKGMGEKCRDIFEQYHMELFEKGYMEGLKIAKDIKK